MAETAEKKPVRLNVEAMPAPKPALKYLLLPEVREMNPGNPVQWYVRLLAPEPAPPRQPARHEEDARSGEHDRICKERQQRHRLTGRQYDRQDHGDAKESYPERHSLASRLPGILQPKVQRAPELQPDQPHLETLVTRSAISGRPCALLTGCGRRL